MFVFSLEVNSTAVASPSGTAPAPSTAKATKKATQFASSAESVPGGVVNCKTPKLGDNSATESKQNQEREKRKKKDKGEGIITGAHYQRVTHSHESSDLTASVASSGRQLKENGSSGDVSLVPVIAANRGSQQSKSVNSPYDTVDHGRSRNLSHASYAAVAAAAAATAADAAGDATHLRSSPPAPDTFTSTSEEEKKHSLAKESARSRVDNRPKW